MNRNLITTLLQSVKRIFSHSQKTLSVREFEREIYFSVVAILIFYFIIFYFSAPAPY